VTPVVLVQHVSKVYHLYRHPSERLLQHIPFVKRPPREEFWALRDVSFEVQRGEMLALVGPNGSGKSTALQIVTGLLQPTSGRVLTRGRVAALLELGAGFNPEFTGRENVYLNSEIMGIPREETDRQFAAIEEFAGIGDFLDRPVKEYSTGMYVRLAFSTAIHVHPDILIVDEALAVGDAIFANRCIKKFEEVKARGVTVLFVSHDLGLVKKLADRALFLLNGRVVAEGAPNDVVNRYVGYVLERQSAEPSPERASFEGASFRHGDGVSRIRAVEVRNAAGERTNAVLAGEPMTIHVEAAFEQDSRDLVAGLLIRTRLGADVYGTNTRVEQVDLGAFARGDIIEIDFSMDCRLTRGDYTVTVATQHFDGSSQDWIDDAVQFSVIDTRDIAGIADLRASVTWSRPADRDRSTDRELV
jgi:ABC-type polysaccharide/polyol phosphate transport system ATPase subunit